MSNPFLAIRQAVQGLIETEWENLRAGIHRPGARRPDALRQRDERMTGLRALLAAAMQPAIGAGFTGETVEARLSAVGRAAEAVTQWDSMYFRDPGGVAYLEPGEPAEWHETDSLADQAEERLAGLATQALTALEGIQNLAIAAAPKRKQPTPQAVKRLYALSGNRCAFPGCGRQIVDPVTGDLKGAIAHINSVSPGGPRYNPRQNDKARLSVENLILLCFDHHTEIDCNSDAYSADFLRGVKAANEGQVRRGKEPSEEVAAALMATISGNTITHGSAIVSEKQIGGQVAHHIINVGSHAWSDSLPRKDQIVFRAYDFSARFMCRDSGGSQSPAKRSNAEWIEYWFKIEIFNTRSINVGLMDILVVFGKNETALHRTVPGQYTGETRVGGAHRPPVRSMDLKANEWTRDVFWGALGSDILEAVRDCDEIFLIANTVDGFTYKCPLGTKITET
jgi:hypothetical protein